MPGKMWQTRGVSVDECTRKWKSLRDRFVRELKKVKKKKTGDPGPPYISCWPLFDTLSFLSDTVKYRSTSTNFANPGVDTPTDPATPQTKETCGESELEEGLVDRVDEAEHSVSLPSMSTFESSSRAVSVESDASASTHKPPTKRRKGNKDDEVDSAIITSLKGIQERWIQKDAEADKQARVTHMDEEGHFGNQVAATLRRLTTRQKAITKLQIDQVLVNVEFP